MNLNEFQGGQFRPASGGQFQPACGGQFKSARGGQFDRRVHSGIDWTHNDFHINTDDNGFPDSKIEGGWDYAGDGEIFLDPVTADEGGHGTSCAGIIGALRNNENTTIPTNFVGIAGIAGGDLENDNNPGVSLFTMKISNSDGFISSSKTLQAYQEGTDLFNLDITNHSYGGPYFDQAKFEGVNYLYQNEVIFVAARGNFPNIFGTAVDAASYPSCFFDDRVINVGANGSDGQLKVNGNGNPFDAGDDEFESQTGFDVDFIAPGTNLIVETTETSTDDYHGFNGTSASAPHVAGLAALMMSLYGNNLAPEDIENIIQNNSVNIGAETMEDVGFGIIDATATLEQLVLPQFQVIHKSGTSSTFTSTPGATLQPLLLLEHYGAYGYIGSYLGSVFDITYTFTHSIPGSATLLDGWVRNSTTEGYSDQVSGTINLPSLSGSNEVLIDETTAQITTRLYKVTHTFLGADIADAWVPEAPADILLNYSLHIFDPLATEIISPDGASDLNLHPNPTSNQITLVSKTNLNYSTCDIFTIDGQFIKSIVINGFSINNQYTVDVSELQDGMYMVRLSNGNISSVLPFIKL